MSQDAAAQGGPVWPTVPLCSHQGFLFLNQAFKSSIKKKKPDIHMYILLTVFAHLHNKSSPVPAKSLGYGGVRVHTFTISSCLAVHP